MFQHPKGFSPSVPVNSETLSIHPSAPATPAPRLALGKDWLFLRRRKGVIRCAMVLVTHGPGAAEALDPQRVVLLPDGTEDFWSDDYRDLIELA